MNGIIERYKNEIDNRISENDSKINFLALETRNNSQKIEDINELLYQKMSVLEAEFCYMKNNYEDMYRENVELKMQLNELYNIIEQCENDYHNMKTLNDATLIVKSHDIMKNIYKAMNNSSKALCH